MESHNTTHGIHGRDLTQTFSRPSREARGAGRRLRRQKDGQAQRELAGSLDTESETCKLSEFLDGKPIHDSLEQAIFAY